MAMTRNELKQVKELSQKKHRAERGQFLVEGVRLAAEAASSDHEIDLLLLTPKVEQLTAGAASVEKLRRKARRVEHVTERELESISETVTSQGLVAVVRSKSFSVDDVLVPGDSPSLLVGFDTVADPGNLGSMVRTCDWFGATGILLGKNSVELKNPKVLRSTMGSVFHLPIVEDVDLLSTVSRAKEMGYTVYVTDAAGETHFDRVRFTQKSLIMFGNEAWGVSDQLKQLADVRLAIRRYGQAESLNVGVACGVVLSDVHRLLEERMLDGR